MRNLFGTLAFTAALAFSSAGTAEERPHGGPSEGIKVHGHWTIEVSNPDGTLAYHAEFENSLVPFDGHRVLARVLGGQESVVSWAILLKDGFLGGPCGTSQPEICQIQVQVNPPGTAPETVQLRGATVTATHDSVIRVVETMVTSSLATYPWPFSQRALGPTEEKPVVAGQLIQVTVVFSFS